MRLLFILSLLSIINIGCSPKVTVNQIDRAHLSDYLMQPDRDSLSFKMFDHAYWEGACEVLDAQGQIIGKAYLELAGYGGGLGARLN